MKRIAIGLMAMVAMVAVESMGAAGKPCACLDGGSNQVAAAGAGKACCPGPQTKCPILGEPIDKSLYVDAGGARIYVCCAGCLDKVKAAPGAAVQKIIANGETPEWLNKGGKPDAPMKPQTRCPVMGDKVDHSRYVDVAGARVYVCCGTCVKAMQKDPGKYIKKVIDAGETVEACPCAPEAKR